MIVTNNDSLAEEMRLLRNMAFKQPRFVHDEAGYNFRMTGFQAALGLVQLSRFDEVLRKKRQIADWYREKLPGVYSMGVFWDCQKSQRVPSVYGILLDPGLDRDSVDGIRFKQTGVETRNFFHPMNLQPCFQTIPQCSSVPCPVAEDLWRRGFSGPSGPNLSEAQIKRNLRSPNKSTADCCQPMSYSGKHAECYDLFYQDKPYQEEARYAAELIRARFPAAKSILDLGCGAGLRCMELARQGYKVSGVDQSASMLDAARRHLSAACDFSPAAVGTGSGDITTFQASSKYDAVISLFHVFSYLATEVALRQAVDCSFANLNPGGVLIFDYWHGPGVMKDPRQFVQKW